MIVNVGALLLIIRTLASVKVTKVRYVVWSPDMAYVALLSKHGKYVQSIFLKYSKQQCTNSSFIFG